MLVIFVFVFRLMFISGTIATNHKCHDHYQDHEIDEYPTEIGPKRAAISKDPLHPVRPTIDNRHFHPVADAGNGRTRPDPSGHWQTEWAGIEIGGAWK